MNAYSFILIQFPSGFCVWLTPHTTDKRHQHQLNSASSSRMDKSIMNYNLLLFSLSRCVLFLCDHNVHNFGLCLFPFFCFRLSFCVCACNSYFRLVVVWCECVRRIWKWMKMKLISSLWLSCMLWQAERLLVSLLLSFFFVAFNKLVLWTSEGDFFISSFFCVEKVLEML